MNGMASRARNTVFYDGDCGFCERSIGVVRAFDWLGLFRYAKLQSEEARVAGIPPERYPSQMVLRTGEGKGTRLWAGWRAVKQIWLRTPAYYAAMAGAVFVHPVLAVALALALTPIGNPLGDWLYRLVARNRHRFPASTCRLENP